MAKINQNLNIFVFISVLCLTQILAADSNPNQIRITDSFTISANHSTETLTTIINDLEQSEDSGIVNGAFHIQSVKFFFIKVFSTKNLRNSMKLLIYYSFQLKTILI